MPRAARLDPTAVRDDQARGAVGPLADTAKKPAHVILEPVWNWDDVYLTHLVRPREEVPMMTH